eukprot:352832-Chlamydomonas_euryale.AAC.2
MGSRCEEVLRVTLNAAWGAGVERVKVLFDAAASRATRPFRGLQAPSSSTFCSTARRSSTMSAGPSPQTTDVTEGHMGGGPAVGWKRVWAEACMPAGPAVAGRWCGQRAACLRVQQRLEDIAISHRAASAHV